MFKKIATIFVLFFFLSAGFPALAFESSSASFEIHAGDIESAVGASGPSANFKLQSGGGQTATGIDGPSASFKVFSGILHWLAGIFSARYNQSAYRWFAKADSKDPGAALAVQNTPITAPTQLTEFRLRMLLHIYNRQLNQSVGVLKLQFAQPAGACDSDFTNETWDDISPSSGAIRYYDNATPTDITDNTSITTNPADLTHSSDTIVTQTYEESNTFSNTTAAIPKGQDGEWDFSLVDFSATPGTSYCFRAVKSDGSLLDTYTAMPAITTTAGGTIPASGTYTSPTFEATTGGESSGIKSGFNTLTWTENRPSTGGTTTVKFQIASNTDNNTWTYKGRDGTASTWYGCSEGEFSNYCSGTCATDVSTTNICRISGVHNNDRYFKIQFTLCNETGCGGSDGFSTPQVEKVILNWSP